MEQGQNRSIRFYIIAVTLAIIAILSFTRFSRRDILFARRAFYGLAQGRKSTERMIDWPVFKAVGADVGVEYLALSDDKERLDYENFFIKSFSENLKKAGGNPKDFTNWRVYIRDALTSVIAADYDNHGKILLLTVSRENGFKLTDMRWEGENAGS